jgi:hypothetical protein
LGTTNVTVQEPTAFVVVVPLRGRGEPANVAVIWEETASPTQLIVAVELTRPPLGFSDRLGTT